MVFDKYFGLCAQCGGDLKVNNQYEDSAVLADAHCVACGHEFELIAQHTLEVQITDAVWQLKASDAYEEYPEEEEAVLIEMISHLCDEEIREVMDPEEFEQFQMSLFADDPSLEDSEQDPYDFM